MRLRHYEMVYILRTDAGDDVTVKLWERIYEIVKAHGGMTTKFDTWGKRKLAYEIDKNSKGVYHYLQFVADNACVAELQRNLRIHDAVLKFLTVLLNEDAKVEDFEEAAVPQPGKLEKSDTAPADSVREAVAKAEDKPAEAPKAEEKPAEEPKAEEKPAEEPKAEEKPAEEAPAEEKPAEEAPVEETPVEETPAEETPAEETESTEDEAEKE